MTALEFPQMAEPLFAPHRIKIAEGGTGAGKTYLMARALLAKAVMEKLFIVCLLEVQSGVEDSAMRLMLSLAADMELDDVFARGKMSIVGANKSEIVFEQVSKCGRMLEYADIVWVDDGHDLTFNSWKHILTACRKPGSEVWVSMNRGRGTGAAEERFFRESIYAPVVISMNWRTNSHFSEALDIERQRALREDVEAYEHEWEGKPLPFDVAGSLTIVGDDGTIEEIPADSPMAVLKRISMDRNESIQSRIDAARALLPYVHRKQPVAIEGLGNAAGVAGLLSPDNLARLSDGDIERMLATLQSGSVEKTVVGEVLSRG